MKQRRLITYANFPTIARWYEEMAARGQFIQKIGKLHNHEFAAGTPAKRTYRFFPTNNQQIFTAFSKEEQAEMHKMSEGLGWHYVDTTYNLDLYYTEEEHPAELYADPQMEKDLFHRLFRREMFMSAISGIIYLLLLFQMWGNRNHYLSFYDNGIQVMPVAGIFIAVAFLLQFGEYARFAWKNRSRWESEKPLWFSRGRLAAVVMPIFEIGILLAILSLVLIFFDFTDTHGSFGAGLVLSASVWLPTLIGVTIGLVLRKVVAPSSMSIQKKQFLTFAIPALVIVATMVLTTLSLGGGWLLPQPAAPLYAQDGLVVEKEKDSFLIPRHIRVTWKQPELSVEISRAASVDIAEKLYASRAANDRRIAEDWGLGPDGERVKDLHLSWLPAGAKAVRLWDADHFLVWRNALVLEVVGDPEDAAVQNRVRTVLEGADDGTQ